MRVKGFVDAELKQSDKLSLEALRFEKCYAKPIKVRLLTTEKAIFCKALNERQECE